MNVYSKWVGREKDLRVELAEAFSVVGPACMKWVNARLRQRGQSYPRLRLLMALYTGGASRMTDLSDELGVTARNVTALVDALEAEGLVKRLPHPRDRRATLIELTPEGHETCAQMTLEHAAIVTEVYGELSETDQRSLIRILGNLRTVLEAKGLVESR